MKNDKREKKCEIIDEKWKREREKVLGMISFVRNN